MTIAQSDTESQRRHKAGILPPWLWFWLLLYLMFLPKTLMHLWQTTVQPILSPEALPAGMGGKAIAAVQALPGIAELLPVVMLLAGVLYVLLPQLRKRQLERTYNLGQGAPASPIMKEITDTVEAYAPGVEIKKNLLRTDQFAFAYPIGYRKSAIAIFGGLIKLWRSDREAGKAILLHELGHCRHGDVLIIGAGSFFETILNSWVRFLALFFIIPTVFVYGWFLLGSLHEHWQLAQQLSEIQTINDELSGLGIDPVEGAPQGNWLVTWLFFQLGMLFTLGLPGTISSIFSLLLQTPIVIALPLMATWCAEFNADRFVISEQTGQEPLLRSLQVMSPPVSRWKWLTSRLSHPPTSLRQWMAVKGLAPMLILLVLLLFPLAYVAKLGFMNVRVIATLVLIFSPAEMWQTLREANVIGLRSVAPILLGAGLMLVLYPQFVAHWERLFCRESQTLNPPSYKEYAIAAGVTGGLGIIAYLLAGSLTGIT